MAEHRGRQEALETLAHLRKLSKDHPYVQEEMSQIIEQIEGERLANPDRGVKKTCKVLWQPSNRRRLAIGVIIFIFMQMAG